jgi:hypothetical protein
VLVLGLAASALLGAVPLTAQAAGQDDVVAHGDDWSVSRVSGGFKVTKTLDEALPVVSDAPTLTVDGASLGTATESADGTILTTYTTLDVSSADDVEVGWSSGGHPAEPTNSPVTSTEAPVAPRTTSRLRSLAVTADDGSTPARPPTWRTTTTSATRRSRSRTSAASAVR